MIPYTTEIITSSLKKAIDNYQNTNSYNILLMEIMNIIDNSVDVYFRTALNDLMKNPKNSIIQKAIGDVMNLNDLFLRTQDEIEEILSEHHYYGPNHNKNCIRDISLLLENIKKKFGQDYEKLVDFYILDDLKYEKQKLYKHRDIIREAYQKTLRANKINNFLKAS